MRKDKERVIQLRRLGKSYNEIRKEVRVPKSTLSEWLGKIKWSQRIREILIKKAGQKGAIHLRRLDKIRGIHLARVYQEASKEAVDEFEYFKYYPLFIAGISLYWGEGDKSTRNLVRLTNIDSRMIRLFVRFLQKICGIRKEKMRVWLLLYPDLNVEECKNFWIRQVGFKSTNFTKPTFIEGRHKTNRLRFGVCTVGVSSTYLKKKFQIWLDLLASEKFKIV